MSREDGERTGREQLTQAGFLPRETSVPWEEAGLRAGTGHAVGASPAARKRAGSSTWRRGVSRVGGWLEEPH